MLSDSVEVDSVGYFRGSEEGSFAVFSVLCQALKGAPP